MELILAIMISSMIALGVTSILYASSYGTSSKREIRRVAVQAEQVRARLDNAARNARQFLATGSGYVVLWLGDTRNDDQVNISELQLIEVASNTTQLKSYTAKWPSGWNDTQITAADTAYPLASDFYAIVQTLKGGSYFPAITWMEDVADFTVTLNEGTPSAARMMSWRFTMTDQLLSETLVGVCSLRAKDGKYTGE